MEKRILVAGCSHYLREYLRNGLYFISKEYYLRMLYKNYEVDNIVETVLKQKGRVLCEVFVDINQVFEPKPTAKKLSDGTLVSSPLEDLAPFIDLEELKKIMIIPLVNKR